MIVGTAGHVDHGKTALLRALTGVDTDRLAEEKRRGISIDLGFAYVPTPDGEILGFVDVPGHHDFLHNMLAGASGIDFALLVVAADDGVMPQTVEHVAILDLLGVTRGIVALTKIDLVSGQRRAEVSGQIAALLRDTGMAGSELIEVSAVTGEGIAALRARVFAAASQTAPRDTGGLFRLIIDRAFTLRGTGTVVTGMVASGAVAIGDYVMVSPAGLMARVRSIHAQNRPVARGIAGQRCALNLVGDGIEKEAIERGEVVLEPSLHAPTMRLDARLRVLASETKPVGTWLPVRLHCGAAARGARLVPLDQTAIAPGDEGLAQLVLDRPIATVWGEPFILRDTSAQHTIGGGRFIDLRAPARRRRSPERFARLAALGLSDPAVAMTAALSQPPHFLDFGAFLRDRAIDEAAGERLAQRLGLIRLAAGGADVVLSDEAWAKITTGIGEVITRFHEAHPDAGGLSPDRLRREVAPRLPAPLFEAAVTTLARRGAILFAHGMVRRPDHQMRLDGGQRALWAKIEPLVSDGARFRPPRVSEMTKALGLAESELRRFLRLCVGLGLLDEVAPDHFFRRDAIAEVVAMLPALAETAPDGQFGAAQLRDRLEGGRKTAIEILEFLDRRGITVRRGDLRRLAPPRPATAS